jgi:diguanylate cyclase (GGDEF)-like protein/PAS domain S-box-containing protein
MIDMKSTELTNQSDTFFQALTEQTSQGISVADLNGNYIFVNKAFCNMIGYSKDELLTMTVFDVKAPNQEHGSFEKAKNSSTSTTIRVTLQRRDGSTFIAEVIGKRISLSAQECILGIVHDISDRVSIEKALIKSELRKNMVVQIANDGIWDWHIDTNLVLFDERYYTMAGYEVDEFPYTFEEWEGRVHPDDLSHTVNNVQSYLKGVIEQFQIEFRFRRKNNSYMWIKAKGKIIEKNPAGEPTRFIGTHSDITMQKEHEEKILQQAHFDSLTGLPNRFLSLDRLKHSCTEAQRNQELVTLLFLDLDDFKKINDSLGHETGDLLLIEAANRLRNVVRAVDTVGRLGGDEFIIILRGLKNPKDAHPIVENLLNKFREMFIIKSRELMLTATVGVAIFPNDATDSSELLRKADSAMYDAKSRGRNTYSYYTDKMNKCAQRRLAIEEQIHGALNREEFSVYYQAKIDIGSSKIMGAEALVRWNNPVLGSVPPDEFIPIAEQTGNIITLGKFVLRQALKQTSIWQQSIAKDFHIAVNLSPRQFRDPQLLTFIKNCLTQYKVLPGHLELEITEGVLLSGHNYVEELLTGINSLGVKMAMDDFGTGYSSLNYLRSYPFDVLKIDRSFINEISDKTKVNALINAIISMSHALNLTVVAEGIETTEQFVQLKKLGCDLGQGYLFSRPVTADEMTLLLKEYLNKRLSSHPH